MSKIERIIQQLEDGTYNVSSEKIAEKLLKKNPNLADTVNMETKIIGDMKGFAVADYMDEGFTALVVFSFLYNSVPYGKYLIGVYADGSIIELDCNGDNFRDFDDDGLMEDAFEEDLEEFLQEQGLV